MKIQWFGCNIYEICNFIGEDISKLLISGKLYVSTASGIRPVPVGAYIRRNSDGTLDIVDK